MLKDPNFFDNFERKGKSNDRFYGWLRFPGGWGLIKNRRPLRPPYRYRERGISVSALRRWLMKQDGYYRSQLFWRGFYARWFWLVSIIFGGLLLGFGILLGMLLFANGEFSITKLFNDLDNMVVSNANIADRTNNWFLIAKEYLAPMIYFLRELFQIAQEIFLVLVTWVLNLAKSFING